MIGRLDNDFLDKIDDLFKKVDFLNETDEFIFDVIVKAYEYCFLNGGGSTYLFKICQIYTRRYKGIHKDVERISLIALRNNDHPDAVVYYCLAVIHNYGREEAMEKLAEAQNYCTNKNTKALILVFEATLYWRNGDFGKYVSLLKTFFNEKDQNFNPYMAIPCSTVWLNGESPKNLVIDKSGKLYQCFENSNHKEIINCNDSVDYIVSISCDSKYFEIYNKYIIESLSFTGDNFICFVTISDTLSSVPNGYDNRFVFNQLDLERSGNIGPISSALRYLAASKVRNFSDKPIVVMDFDCVIKGSLIPLIEAHKDKTMALRFLEKQQCLPWQHITAGFGIFYCNEISNEFLSTIEAFLYHSLTLDGEQWWVDQNSLEVAGRFVSMNKVSNLFHDLPMYTVIPTGSQNSKLTRLSNALQSIKFEN
ncbi:hypothetical protein [Leeia oryzae]|uniref:hypothetical protein n=1 Tax=Leeia oryzae TaxID=356662 RepID=UPI00036548FE|nr:hypothetical protein [Leeia oryzae]